MRAMLKFISFLSFFLVCSVHAHTRGLVVVIDLAEEASKNKLMYKTETHVAAQRIKNRTLDAYDKVLIFHRKNATKANFIQGLGSILEDEKLSVVDVIIYVHGKNESYENGPSLCFVGDKPCTSTRELSQEIQRLKFSEKLRALYSDACWGATHMQDFLNAGFKVANGSRGVDSNHSLDLRRFLSKWVKGKSFAQSNNHANKAKLTHLTDKIIKNADSFKELAGDAEISINSFDF